MADRTPRLCYSNLVQLVAAIFTASSTEASTPLEWIRDPQVTKVWRSVVGWNVSTGFNDKFDFSEAGVARVATLTTGNYSTGPLYASQVQDAMNAAPGATNTYTVSYSASTHLFTVARATGTNALVLKLNTGANVGAGAGPDLGMSTAADKSGGTTYAGDTVAYHSREWVVINAGAAVTSTVAALVGHTPLATGGTIRAQGHTSNAWTAPTVDQLLAGTDRLLIQFFNSASLQWWRFLINDVQNTNGYSQLGVPFVGPYLQPGRSILQGYSEQIQDLSDMSESDGGAFYQNKRSTRKRWDLTFPRLSYSDRDALDLIQTTLGIGRGFFVSLDPLNNPAETRYVVMDKPFDEVQSVGDGSRPERFSVRLSLVEAVV